MSVWIADVLASDPTRRKIRDRHGIDVDDIRSGLIAVPGLSASLDVDPIRGERWLVKFHIGDHLHLAVLYDAHHELGGVWHLASAYRLD